MTTAIAQEAALDALVLRRLGARRDPRCRSDGARRHEPARSSSHFRSSTVALEVRRSTTAGPAGCAPMLLCLLAYHVIRTCARRWPAPVRGSRSRQRRRGQTSPVTAARVSPAAAAKAASRRTADGQPAHSCAPCSRTWRPSPATPSASATPAVTMLAKPTPLQAGVFHRLGLASRQFSPAPSPAPPGRSAAYV